MEIKEKANLLDMTRFVSVMKVYNQALKPIRSYFTL